MHHSEILGIVLACLAVVRAQTPGFNTFIAPAAGQDVRAGQNFDITWQPANAPDGATISIKLLQGQSINTLQDGPNVASNIPSNAGRFTWAVPRSIQDNEVYSLKMTLDGKEEIFQNSAFFDIDNLDNDDDDRPPVPPQPEPPAAAPLPPSQVPGQNPKNPARLRLPDDDDDDDDDRDDNDDNDDKDDNDDYDDDDDDDDDNRRPRLPSAAPALPPTPLVAPQNGVPKTASNTNKSNEIASPQAASSTPAAKSSASSATNDIDAADPKLKNGTSIAVAKAGASAGAPSKSEATAAASVSSSPKSKSTSLGPSSDKPGSVPSPFINSGTASFTINSLFFLLGGIAVIFAL